MVKDANNVIKDKLCVGKSWGGEHNVYAYVSIIPNDEIEIVIELRQSGAEIDEMKYTASRDEFQEVAAEALKEADRKAVKHQSKNKLRRVWSEVVGDYRGE